MSPMQIEAQAPSGTILAFRPCMLPPPSPTSPAPGWVPDELGLFRAVLLATAVAAMMAGGALTLLVPTQQLCHGPPFG